jgi:hypothetical protein
VWLVAQFPAPLGESSSPLQKRAGYTSN